MYNIISAKRRLREFLFLCFVFCVIASTARKNKVKERWRTGHKTQIYIEKIGIYLQHPLYLFIFQFPFQHEKPFKDYLLVFYVTLFLCFIVVVLLLFVWKTIKFFVPFIPSQ